MRKLGRMFVVMCSGAAALAAGDLAAWDPATDGRWTIGVRGVAILNGSDRSELQIFPVEQRVSYGVEGTGAGFGVTAGYRLSRHLGLQFGASLSDLDVELRTEGPPGAMTLIESAKFENYELGADWFITPDRSYDARIGVLLAQTKLDDVIFLVDSQTMKFTFDDDYGFGVRLGIDWPIGGERWMLSAEATYLQTILESDSGAGDADFSPVMVSAGFTFRP